MRRHTDEIKIAVSAALFCGVMLLIYVVVPQSIRIPTATTTLKEAPATAAEAEAATGSTSSGSDFPIYNQESNYQDNPSGEDTSADNTYTPDTRNKQMS